MANVDVAQFEFTCNTGTGDQTIASGLGFTPKGYIIWSTLNTSDATFQIDANAFVGFSDGTTTFCHSYSSDDAAGTSVTSQVAAADFRFSLNGSTTLDAIATHSSFGSGTIVINWSNAPSSAFKFYGIAFGGDTFSCEVKTFEVGTTGTGNISYTTTMSNPLCGFFVGTPYGNPPAGNSIAHGTVSLGMALSSTKRGLFAIASENGRANMDTWRHLKDTKCMVGLDASTGAQSFETDFVSWNSNGFTLNYTTAPPASTRTFGAFVMKGASFDMGTLAKRTSTGDSVVNPSNVGTVKGIIMFSDNTALNASAQSHARLSMGAASSTTQEGGCWTGDTDAAGTSITATRSEDSNILVMATENDTVGSSTLEAVANISSMGTNTFTLTYTTCTTLAADIIWWVIGEVTSTLYERALDESSISVSETLDRLRTAPTTLSESSISVSDSNTRVLTAIRSLPESSISVSEDLQRILTAMRTLDESGITVSETVSTLFTQVRSIDESVSVSETVDRILTAFRTITESTIDVSETVSGNLFFTRELSEAAISVSETLARTLYANRAIDENVAVSESVDRILTAFRTIGEAGISVSETVQSLFIQVRSIDESVSVSDQLVRMATFFRTLSESAISVSEQLDRILTANRIISESSIAVSETVDRQLLAFRTLAESSIVVSETVERVLTAFRTISEPSVSVSETIDRILTAMRVLSESSISVSETLERTFYANLTISETVTVTEQLERILTAYRTIDESSISVSETLTYFVPIVRTINEPSVTVSDSIARLLSAFRVISESVSVSDHLAIVGPDYEIAVYITDKGYTNSLRARIRFVDRHDESHVLYEYDSFNPEQRPFNILGASIRLAQGEIGGFTINIEDSAKTVIKDNIGFGTKVQIDVKKEYGIPWMRVMTGFIRRVGKIRSATNTLQWQIAGVGTQVVFNERVTNYKRAAKRSSVDSIDPLPTDSRMFASNLFKDLISATDILPLRRPSLMETGGFTLDEISPDVTDFIAQVSPGLTDAASVANAFSELTGAIWGCNSEGNPFFRYLTQKHSGIIIKDDPQDTDSALITSTNLDAFDYQDSIDLSEGFANRLYVLNAIDTKSTASSSGASGSTTLTFRGIAQQFTATDNNINGAAFILSKVGNPTNKDNCVFGYLRGDSNGYPTGPTLASFQITFDQIETAKSTIFVNDIKPKEGTIIPGNKYWWFLFSALTSESNTIRWHHDNDQLTINRFSAILPFIDQDPTKAGNQLFWTRSDKGPVYAFSTFSSIRHILEHSDPESIKEYGLVEGIVDLPAFEDDNTFQKALLQILKTSSKPKRIYNYARVTIPTQTLFFPGELVTIIDSKADLTSEKNVIAEIAQVQYTFDTSRNAMGCKTVDIMLMGFVDKVLDDYLDNNTC